MTATTQATNDTQATNEKMSEQVRPHSGRAKAIHWGFIAVFIYGLAKQVDEVEELEDTMLLLEEIAFAIVFLVLLFGRFVYMRSTRPTAMPSDTPRNMMLLARAVHLGMYICLALIALSGLTIGGLYGSGIKEGAVLEAVLLFHEIVFWTSMNLIAIHIAGAIYHRYLGDGIWDSMVPVWKKGSGDSG